VKLFFRTINLGYIILYLLIVPVLEGKASALAQISKNTSQHEKINMAQKLYFDGNFDLAIDLIKQCLQEGITADNEKVRAYKILAQAYLAKDYQQPAMEVIKKLLDIVPEYSPVLEEDPPQFVELVKKVKTEASKKTTGKPKPVNEKPSPWLWVGSAGALIIGTSAILFLTGPKTGSIPQNKTLPHPPDWPE